MRKLAFIITGMFVIVAAIQAQDKKALDSVDNVIIKSIIDPATEAGNPDWTAIAKQVRVKYTAVQTDRAVTKARIFYNWSKDWPAFSNALVHYTDVYEDKNDFKLMHKNAKMVLEHSENPEDWKAAQKWLKYAIDKGSDNPDYKKTYDDLTTKINASK